jgi:hypothetical protein
MKTLNRLSILAVILAAAVLAALRQLFDAVSSGRKQISGSHGCVIRIT